MGLELHSPKLVGPLIPSDLWKGLRLNECVSGEACWWVSGPQDVAEISVCKMELGMECSRQSTNMREGLEREGLVH